MVMHPGPMNRGLEISADAADSPRSTVLDQVTHGVSVRMAVLYLLLAGERGGVPEGRGLPDRGEMPRTMDKEDAR
jgi:aspartate carbamoyltransferase catalytic subunit